MRNFFLLSSFDHSAKGLLQDPKQAIDHLRLVPEEALETLHPFKVGDDYTARVAKYIRDYKNLVPTFEQDLIGVDGGRSIGAFRQNPAANFPGVLSMNYSTDGRRYQDVARQSQEIVGGIDSAPGNPARSPCCRAYFSAARTSIPCSLW